jgi:hypothetical protein
VARLKVLTAAKMKMAVCWDTAPFSQIKFTDLAYVGKFLPDYTAQQPRRQPSSFPALISMTDEVLVVMAVAVKALTVIIAHSPYSTGLPSTPHLMTEV